MSIRAYKVIEIKTEESPTFNLTHDEKIFDLLMKLGFIERLNMDCCGIMEVSKESIEDVLTDPEQSENYNEEETAILNKIIADCGNEDYVSYQCY
jgi:hypothetical protein